MENILRQLRLPFIAILLILIAMALINVSGAYNNYWQGRLAKARFKNGNFKTDN